MTFTKLKPYKLWAEHHRMPLKDIEEGLKIIDKKGRIQVGFTDINHFPPRVCPFPSNSFKN